MSAMPDFASDDAGTAFTDVPTGITDAPVGLTLAVVGPTAVGKSSLAIELAHDLNGEIINADSMQTYKGMDIGTAKVTSEQMQGIPHHLLDIWPITQTASVAVYQELARAVIADIHARGKAAILVGGSGLYVRAALDDLEFPGVDPVVRARLEAEAASVGTAVLFDRLLAVDPMAATAIGPDNTRKIIRALEVVELRGSFSATLPSYRYLIPALQIGVTMDRPTLDERIALRVGMMFAQGFVDEVRGLLSQGLREGVTASKALGYAQVIAHLDGDLELEQAIELTASTTRRFVRRQQSWFHRDPRITWLDATDAVELKRQAHELIAAFAPTI
jgi:tRNA dimethylallyltransferase